MEQISITAVFTPKEGKADALQSELKKAQKASRQEPGCLQYDLHQSIDDDTLVLHELYENNEAVQQHINSEHYQEYRKNTEDLLASRNVYKLKKLD
ncbi:putative quinol monooxygenase [Pontibacillus salicampi]|uniref:Quinol monooxygenase n=1 Tax=Pontibacillus salicampi TaxID=1449801 RepID=A0ABV6LIG0_9BACI